MSEPTQPAQPAPAPVRRPVLPSVPVPNLHNIASILETLSFIIAAVLYLLGHGADQNNAITTALFGAVFHAYNH